MNKKHKIIYLFGSDASGKTTLARELQDISKCHIIHGSYDKTWNMFEYHKALINSAEELSEYQVVVLDRWSIDENVYSEVFRDSESYDTKKLIDSHKNNIIFIYCRPSDIIKRFDDLKNKREEMFDNMDGIVKKFDEYVDSTNLEVYVYDFTDCDMHKFALNILNK